jgi:hypothetical protein
MLSLIGMLGGALVRYLPNLFGFAGDWFKGRQEQKQEEAALRLQIELEKAKAETSVRTAYAEGEQAQALATIQGTLEELRLSVADRQGARDYGSKLHTALVNVLQAGAGLGLPRWVLSIGWAVVVVVEAGAASVQPGIAACGFGMWAAWKWSIYSAALHSSGNVPAALISLWVAEDWLLIDSIVGFFLAGRAMKYVDARGCK